MQDCFRWLSETRLLRNHHSYWGLAEYLSTFKGRLNMKTETPPKRHISDAARSERKQKGYRHHR